MIRRVLLPAVIFISAIELSLCQPSFRDRLSDAALELTRVNVIYDPGYYRIPYPNGDISQNRGVCTDVIIRAYRILGTDLQERVHKDMKLNFGSYPHLWGLSGPDRNIDHRRVPNLMNFFSRHGAVLPVTENPEEYNPGDIVCWDLGGGIAHIGLVVNRKSGDGKRYQVVHNIGAGQVLADCLFQFRITGHYYYETTVRE